jgi:hypothetical protein
MWVYKEASIPSRVWRDVIQSQCSTAFEDTAEGTILSYISSCKAVICTCNQVVTKYMWKKLFDNLSTLAELSLKSHRYSWLGGEFGQVFDILCCFRSVQGVVAPPILVK